MKRLTRKQKSLHEAHASLAQDRLPNGLIRDRALEPASRTQQRIRTASPPESAH